MVLILDVFISKTQVCITTEREKLYLYKVNNIKKHTHIFFIRKKNNCKNKTLKAPIRIYDHCLYNCIYIQCYN